MFMQYVHNMAKWFGTYDPAEITSMFGSENLIDIPFDSFINVYANTNPETPESPVTPIQESVLKTIESWGFQPDGTGAYVYNLDNLTLKVALGADGSVSMDLTNAEGKAPTAEEMRAVFEG
jgi:hypothetical protein